MISRRELFALFKINVPSLLAFFVAHSDEHQHDVSIQISEISVTWNLARVFSYLPSFFPNCGLYLLNGFIFYIDLLWMAWTENQEYFQFIKKIPCAGLEHSSYLTTPTHPPSPPGQTEKLSMLYIRYRGKDAMNGSNCSALEWIGLV